MQAARALSIIIGFSCLILTAEEINQSQWSELSKVGSCLPVRKQLIDLSMKIWDEIRLAQSADVCNRTEIDTYLLGLLYRFEICFKQLPVQINFLDAVFVEDIEYLAEIFDAAIAECANQNNLIVQRLQELQKMVRTFIAVQ